MVMTNKSQPITIGIVGGTNFARYPKISNEKTVNMMVTISNEVKSLVDNSGYCKEISFEPEQPRALYVSVRLNKMIAVIGRSVYAIDTNLDYQLVGSMDSFEGPVYITENLASQIGIVDNLALYIYNYSLDTFTRIDIPDVTPAYISFLDTYFIITDSNRNFWQISNSDDGTTYDPLMVAYLQTAPDELQAVVPLNRTLWVMGQKVSELWNDNPTGYNASGIGNPVSFPFQRNNSLAINYGVLSVPSICVGFNMLVWLAFNAVSGPTIVYTEGGQVNDLSTDGLDYILKNILQFPEQSYATLRQENGHIIYQITFYNPADNLSIQYDFSSKVWSNCTDENQNFHIMKELVYFNNNQYFINFDQDKPGLYLLDALIDTYDGATIPRIRVCPPIRFQDKKFVVKQVELQMEQGQNEEPTYVDMSISKDGGERFGNWVRYQMFPVGKRKGQVHYYNLGMANDLRLQFMFLSKGRFTVLDGTAEVRV